MKSKINRFIYGCLIYVPDQSSKKFSFVEFNASGQVWLDEYKELFYSRINHKLGNYGDVSDRKELRLGLKCRSIGHVLDKSTNLFPAGASPGSLTQFILSSSDQTELSFQENW